MKSKKILLGTFVILSAMSTNAFAKIPKEEADKLLPGGELTPFGGIVKGNADGSIPAYSGGIQDQDIPAGYAGGRSIHPNPYADDKPLFTITAQNVDQYKDKLTPGMLALFKNYPDTF